MFIKILHVILRMVVSDFNVVVHVITNGFLITFPMFWNSATYVPRNSAMGKSMEENQQLIVKDKEILLKEIERILNMWLKTINDAGSVE